MRQSKDHEDRRAVFISAISAPDPAFPFGFRDCPNPSGLPVLLNALTLYFAYFASQSKLVIVNLNFPDLLNFPKHVPREIKFGREIEVARCIVLTGK